jgi:hypothetical protein
VLQIRPKNKKIKKVCDYRNLHNKVLEKSTYDNEIVYHKCFSVALVKISSDRNELTLGVMNRSLTAS